MFVFVPETEGVALNGTCTDNSNCTDNVPNSVCEADTCKCETGYQENSGNCESKCGLINSWQFVIIINCLLILFSKGFQKNLSGLNTTRLSNSMNPGQDQSHLLN